MTEGDADILRQCLLSWPEVRRVLDILMLVGDKPILIGGAVRDAIIDPQRPPHDLDFVVSKSALDRLRRIQLPNVEIGENRHGNPRFMINGTQVDVFAPQTFFKSFDSITDLLSYTDVNINGIGLSLLHSEIYDPLNGIEALASDRCTLVEPRWHDQLCGPEAAVLRVRLISLLRRYPQIICTNPSPALANSECILLENPAIVWKYLGCPPQSAVVELQQRLEQQRRAGAQGLAGLNNTHMRSVIWRCH